MSTVLRAELSKRNPWYISKHRYYELKHFCLQYNELTKRYSQIVSEVHTTSVINTNTKNDYENTLDITSKSAFEAAKISEQIDIIRRSAYEADETLCDYILKGVTKGYSYDYLHMMENIPCGKDTYYDRYRKFFWLLDKKR